MKDYELTLVLPSATTPAKKKNLGTFVEKLIAGKGAIEKAEDWGEKELAYEIKKNKSGIFLHFRLKLKPDSVKGIIAKLKLNEGVIRYLLVRKNN